MHIPPPPSLRPTTRALGFGLVEVLVAMAIGMIGILAIMQAFAMNERYKENTLGASGSQTNGNIALFTIERDARMAGYGLTDTAALGCNNVQYSYQGHYSSPPGAGAGTLPTLRLVPIVIDQGAAGASDTITMLSSGNAFRTSPASLKDNMPSTSAELKVENGMGFEIGDLAIATQGSTCSLMEVTQIQDPAGHYQHRPTSDYNPPGGTNQLPGYTIGAQIFTLGKPQLSRYTVANNALTVADWTTQLTSGTPSEIVDEIVNLQAQYGKDTDGDNVADTYDEVTPADAAGWMTVITVRIAVLARGAYERPDTNGTCNATAVMPTWAGGTIKDPNVADGSPSCYRYRVFESTVPIRNMIWRAQRP
jgi:type IV pilus assembly protein PilW